MTHTQLNIAEEASGKLVTLVRNNAARIAEEEGRDLIQIDGSPGISGPVIASLASVDLELSVTEPTMSGMHDLERILDVADHFKVASAVCVNKYDINDENSSTIAEYCQARGRDRRDDTVRPGGDRGDGCWCACRRILGRSGL